MPRRLSCTLCRVNISWRERYYGGKDVLWEDFEGEVEVPLSEDDLGRGCEEAAETVKVESVGVVDG